MTGKQKPGENENRSLPVTKEEESNCRLGPQGSLIKLMLHSA